MYILLGLNENIQKKLGEFSDFNIKKREYLNELKQKIKLEQNHDQEIAKENIDFDIREESKEHLIGRDQSELFKEIIFCNNKLYSMDFYELINDDQNQNDSIDEDIQEPDFAPPDIIQEKPIEEQDLSNTIVEKVIY